MSPTSLDSPRKSGAGSGWLSTPSISKTAAKAFAWTLLAIFCIYRLATFVPQPLDGPHTLRPILNGWFDAYLRWHEHPETAYENWRAFCLFGLLIPPALAVVNLLREHARLRLPSRAQSILCSRGLFFAAIAAILLLCRFPTLVAYQLNPDEGEFLSGAHKLFFDGNYFHSVDCGTSGPLNIYPLMLPAIFGLSPDYTSSRVLVLLVAFAAIYLLYRTLRLLAPDAIARIAILPLALALAVFENPNLVHYSSEQIPVLLIAVTLYTAVRVLRNPAAYRAPLFFLGVLVSAAFFSKMQSVPIVGMLAAVAVVYTYAARVPRGFWQPGLLFIAGMLPLQMLNALMCLIAGGWHNFWISYIVSNQRYADVGSNFVAEMPRLVNFFFETPEVGYFLFTFLAVCAACAFQRLRSDPAGERSSLWQMAAVAAVVIGGLTAALLHIDATVISTYVVLIAVFTGFMSFLLLHEHGSFGRDPVRWFGLMSIVATSAAVFSVYRPHRTFPHYLFFLFLPVSAVIGWLLIRQTEPLTTSRESADPPSRFPPLALPLLVAALVLTQATYLWGSRDPHRFRTTVATVRPPVGDLVRALTSPQGRIFVWGWTPDPYLGSGHVSATRDLNLFYQFLAPDEITSYYRDRLLQDLTQHPPELFIDAIGPSSWVFQDTGTYGLDQVPEIARFVNDFYRQVAEAYGYRFFLRSDLASRAASVKLPKTCAPNAIQCVADPQRSYPDGATTLAISDLSPIELPEHAMVEVEFTPFGRQTDNATIFNNEAVPRSYRGFRFQNMGGDLYRLLLGLGDRWAFSRPVLLPDGKPVRLTVEFNGPDVRIQANGQVVDTMHLPAAMTDAPGPVTIGSWINGWCRFSGAIQFFQITDLGEHRSQTGTTASR